LSEKEDKNYQSILNNYLFVNKRNTIFLIENKYIDLEEYRKIDFSQFLYSVRKDFELYKQIIEDIYSFIKEEDRNDFFELTNIFSLEVRYIYYLKKKPVIFECLACEYFIAVIEGVN
jgi:hypothetical protein